MMLWAGAYEEWFAAVLGPSTWVSRRHAATLLVRHLDGCSLNDAARRLGWQSGRGYYHLRDRLSDRLRHELELAITTAGRATEKVLPNLMAYGRARTVLADKLPLTSDDLLALPTQLAVQVDLVNAWVWAELTGGPPAAWRAVPVGATRCTPQWRGFDDSLDSAARTALHAVTERAVAHFDLPGVRPSTVANEALSVPWSKLSTYTAQPGGGLARAARQRSAVLAIREAVPTAPNEHARRTTR